MAEYTNRELMERLYLLKIILILMSSILVFVFIDKLKIIFKAETGLLGFCLFILEILSTILIVILIVKENKKIGRKK